MAKFKNKKGGICEVYSLDNINKLRKDKNYTEISNKLEKDKPNTSEQNNSSLVNQNNN